MSKFTSLAAPTGGGGEEEDALQARLSSVAHYAECDHDTSREVEFKEDDPYYSNQGAAGTCTRHAVAKAMQKEIERRCQYGSSPPSRQWNRNIHSFPRLNTSR